MNAIPIILFWGLAIWGLAGARPVLIYLFFASMPFGSFAVIPPEITGGLTFTATPVMALLLIYRNLFTEQGLVFLINAALDIRRLGLIFGFWFVAIITTIFMPRYFAWQVEIVPMRGFVDQPDLLRPTVQNISQMVYLTISVFTVAAFARLLQSVEMRAHSLRGICLGAFLTVFTGLLDMATQWLPLQPLLEPFRTATYSLLTDVEVLDSKRVVGLMPEASAYGGLSVGFLSLLYFFRRAMAAGALRNTFVPMLILLLMLFTWLSTSSSAYLGLAAFLFVAGLEWFTRAALPPQSRQSRSILVREFWMAFLILTVVLLLVLVRPDLFEPIVTMIDRMIFQKTTSESFEIRSMWTAVSLQAFIDTYGLGVGMGATRTSNSLIAVLSNCGLIGALLYYAFVLQSLVRKAHPEIRQDVSMLNAAKWSFAPDFVVAVLAVSTAEFGLPNAFRFGLIAAFSLRPCALGMRRAQTVPQSGIPIRVG